MMMECPRCGFSQPQDRYCASCGLDVEHYVVKPQPLWLRVVQNSNLHLTLIGCLILLVIGYLFFAQRGNLGREMGALFDGTPLSSRDAALPESDPPKSAPSEPATFIEQESAPNTKAANDLESTADSVGSTDSVEKLVEPERLEVSHWEMPRESLSALLVGAEKVGESNAGRAYLWTRGGKVAEAVQTSRRLGLSRTTNLGSGAQISIETPPAAPDAFQFGIYFQASKAEGTAQSVRWDSTMVLPLPEPAPTVAAGTAAGTQGGSTAGTTAGFPGGLPPTQPTPTGRKTATQINLNGSATLTTQTVLLIVLEPSMRALRDDHLSRAGQGPWNIFSSEEFHSGLTDWVVLVQLK